MLGDRIIEPQLPRVSLLHHGDAGTTSRSSRCCDRVGLRRDFLCQVSEPVGPFPDHVLVVDDGDREAGNLVAALRFEPDFEELQRLLDARMTGEVIGRDRRR